MLIVTLLTLVAAGGVEAQGRPGMRGRMQNNAELRRAELQRRVLERFVERSSRELSFTAAERTAVQEILLRSNERRQDLAREAVELRRRLTEAMRNPQTGDETLAGMLDQLVELRDREHRMWREEQNELARTLPPRKRAQMTLRLLRLQDDIRAMINQRPGAGPDTIRDGIGGADTGAARPHDPARGSAPVR
jgi:hypothetical protein